MSIAQIVRDRKGKAGKSRAWRVMTIHNGDIPLYELWHYGTLMLRWSDTYVEYMDTGHGSVSDQNGMNIAFSVLHVPYYYSRAGGPEIKLLDAPLFKYRRS